MNPLVSVIMAAYNHEKYIERAIESIIGQTYKNIELIIIDDGSSDGTYKKIEKLSSRCNERFIRYVFQRQENLGVRKTLNKLIKLVNGNLIFGIASDDVAKPDCIETEVLLIKDKPKCGLVVGDSDFIDENDQTIFKTDDGFVRTRCDNSFSTFSEFYSKKIRTKDFGTYKSFYTGNYMPNGYLYRKEIFEKILPFTDKAPLEDWWFMLQVSKYYDMEYVDRVLFSYRIHEFNTVNDKQKMNMITQKTYDYENEILHKIINTGVKKDVLDVYMNGVCIKKKGLDNIFTIETYIKGRDKIKRINIFNMWNIKYKKKK